MTRRLIEFSEQENSLIESKMNLIGSFSEWVVRFPATGNLLFYDTRYEAQ
jgi:hypothetical protein